METIYSARKCSAGSHRWAQIINGKTGSWSFISVIWGDWRRPVCIIQYGVFIRNWNVNEMHGNIIWSLFSIWFFVTPESSSQVSDARLIIMSSHFYTVSLTAGCLHFSHWWLVFTFSLTSPVLLYKTPCFIFPLHSESSLPHLHYSFETRWNSAHWYTRCSPAVSFHHDGSRFPLW